MPTALLDSNIVIYAFQNDPRADEAERILCSRHGISVQTLNEFVNVARRKLRFSEDEIENALIDIISACAAIHPIGLSTHLLAFRLSNRYRLTIYDALIVAVALEAGCDTLYSEDMHHGLVIEDQLTIIDPFA